MIFDVSCSLVTFKNDVNVLKKTLVSFLAVKGLRIILYVYDNSPTDAIKLICNDERVHYIHDPSNVGFSKGHNHCIEKILEKSHYHIILNPDVYFSEGTIERLLTKIKSDNSIGLISPKVLYENGELQYSCRLLPSPIDLLIRRIGILSRFFSKRISEHNLESTKYQTEMEVPFILGCFMLFPTPVLKKIGLLDERFFMYMEDVDLTRRVRKFYKTLFFPEACIFHVYEKGSSKKMHLLFIHIQSAIRYFNKWGWIQDNERSAFNEITLMKIKSDDTKAL